MKPVPRAKPQPAPVPANAPAKPLLVKPSGDQVTIREVSDRSEEDEPQRFEIGKFFAPYLASTVVHILLIVILGLWVIAAKISHDVDLTALMTVPEGVQLEHVVVGTEQGTDPVTIVDSIETASIDPFEGMTELMTLPTESNDLVALDVENALSGRSEGMRKMLAGKYGATGKSEQAVLLGLEWLAKNQGRDGLWSLLGPYDDGAYNENPEAATAMALLAFQGAGNTHLKGRFATNVAHGMQALLKRQQGDGNFFRGSGMSADERLDAGIRNDDWLYCHAQCTIALCELYAMTKDSTLREPAIKAVEFCVRSQDVDKGGWRYRPKIDSDTSVTGWMVMALQSAMMAGIDIPSTTISHVEAYLDRVSFGDPDGSRYAYQPDWEVTLAMTAEGLLCRQYLGWKKSDQRLIGGVEHLLENLPRLEERDVYYWYYATQVMHHREGTYWSRWNNTMRDLLVNSQETDGSERGSWDPLGTHPDAWASKNLGGRLYVTCMSLFMLEVYYRHLPIYSTSVARGG